MFALISANPFKWSDPWCFKHAGCDTRTLLTFSNIHQPGTFNIYVDEPEFENVINSKYHLFML